MQSKWWKYGLLGIAGVLALCIVFGAGIFVGRLSLRGNFARPFRVGLASISGTHGAVGTVKSIDGQTMTVQLRNGATQSIVVDSGTLIDRNRKTIPLQSLKPGDQVVVIGSPSSRGQIAARFVRVVDTSSLPAPWWQIFIPR